jgi:uncharacterized membrane protein
MFRIRDFKKLALARLSGHWGYPVLITLLVFVIDCLLGSPALAAGRGRFDRWDWEDFFFSFNWRRGFTWPDMGDFFRLFQGGLLQTVFSLVSFLVSGAFAIALARFYLILSANPPKATFGAFVEGLNRWGKGILLLLWQSLWLFLWGLLFFGLAGAAVALGAYIVYSATGSFLFWAGPLPLLALGVIILLVVMFLCVVYVNRVFAYSQAMFFQAEYPSAPVARSLKASVVMTRGYRGSLFLLELSFIGWAVLALLSAGIGFLWLAPYVRETRANAYRFLKAKAIETGAFAVQAP